MFMLLKKNSETNKLLRQPEYQVQMSLAKQFPWWYPLGEQMQGEVQEHTSKSWSPALIKALF